MPHPYADTLTTLLTKSSSEIVAWLRTEQAKGVLPVGVAVTVLIELVSRTIDQPQPTLDPASVMAGLVQAAENYLGEATFPTWAGGDCKRCGNVINYEPHDPECKYKLAEQTLGHWIGVFKSGVPRELIQPNLPIDQLNEQLRVYKSAAHATRTYLKTKSTYRWFDMVEAVARMDEYESSALVPVDALDG